MKKLHCEECNKYLGIVRDGNLHKNIVCLCEKCHDKLEKYKTDAAFGGVKGYALGDMFGDLFDKK